MRVHHLNCGSFAPPLVRAARGLSDFPAAITSPDFLDRRRYRSSQWAHGVAWTIHAGRGDVWKNDLTGHEVLPGITLVPMPGHSCGHAAVAVDGGARGLLVTTARPSSAII